MLKTISKIFLFFTIIIVITACVKNNDAQDMILNFYNQYSSPSITETDRQTLIKKHCTKSMLETLDILYSFDDEYGLIVGIDYDPFLNAQDFSPIQNIKIEKINENKYKISWDKDTFVILNTVKDKKDWKIDSVDIENLEQIKKDVDDYWNKKGKSNPKLFSK